MYEGSVKTENIIVDPGIDKGIERLTPEKIEQVITSFLKSETGARFKTYTDICVHCGLCSEACHFFLSYDRNPRYSPAAKVKQTVGEILEKNGKVSPEFIRQMALIAFTECNACRRCAMYCPFGIDVAYLMLTMRRL